MSFILDLQENIAYINYINYDTQAVRLDQLDPLPVANSTSLTSYLRSILGKV